jgi:uncharacterized protein YndB with AHSA1/START domain
MTTKSADFPGAQPGQPAIRLERRYEAAVEDLWYLWTTKEGFESWWGPQGFRVEVHKLDLRVGGDLIYDMIAAEPEHIEYLKKMNMPPSHRTRGKFLAIVPMQRLEIGHLIDFIPGVKPYENNTVVEFFPEGSSVRMVIASDRHMDDEWTQRATQGWESQLTKLPAVLAAHRRRT